MIGRSQLTMKTPRVTGVSPVKDGQSQTETGNEEIAGGGFSGKHGYGSLAFRDCCPAQNAGKQSQRAKHVTELMNDTTKFRPTENCTEAHSATSGGETENAVRF